MRWFNRWLSLAPSQRLLVIEAAFILVVVRAGLRLISFREMNRMARYFSRPNLLFKGTDKQAPEQVIWAVDRVGLALLGQNSCLAMALAGQILLGRRGIQSRLRIGVKKTEDGSLLAHAWLEGEHGILLGGASSDLQRYVALPDLETAGE